MPRDSDPNADLPPSLRRRLTARRPTALVSYAQNAEDIRLARVFDLDAPGFYVDVGAGDPIEWSVTKLFYDRGWSGINIEPGPRFSRLEEERPRDVNLRIAVSLVEGPREFWVSSTHWGLSTLNRPPETDIPNGCILERVTVPSHPLSRIFEANACGREIDFLTIDVEGAEREVLQSMDFATTRPTVVVVESLTPLTYEPSHLDSESILFSADYVLAAFDGVNRFYVPADRRDLIQELSYPVSALDLFRRHDDMRDLLSPAKAVAATNHSRLGRSVNTPSGTTVLVEREIRLLDIYERRPLFRASVEASIGLGAFLTSLTRRILRRPERIERNTQTGNPLRDGATTGSEGSSRTFGCGCAETKRSHASTYPSTTRTTPVRPSILWYRKSSPSDSSSTPTFNASQSCSRVHRTPSPGSWRLGPRAKSKESSGSGATS